MRKTCAWHRPGGDLQRQRQPLGPGEPARDRQRRHAADAERRGVARRGTKAVGRHRLGVRAIGDPAAPPAVRNPSNPLQRDRLLARQPVAPAQRLHIILAADDRAGQHAVPEDAAEIPRPGAEIVRVDREIGSTQEMIDLQSVYSLRLDSLTGSIARPEALQDPDRRIDRRREVGMRRRGANPRRARSAGPHPAASSAR